MGLSLSRVGCGLKYDAHKLSHHVLIWLKAKLISLHVTYGHPITLKLLLKLISGLKLGRTMSTVLQIYHVTLPHMKKKHLNICAGVTILLQ